MRLSLFVVFALATAHEGLVATLNSASAAESAEILRELRRTATTLRGLAGDLGLAPSARRRQGEPAPSERNAAAVSRFFGPPQ